MHDVLALAKLRVERDGRIVAVVGLDEDDPRVALGGDALELGDQGRGDAAASMVGGDREIVDVDLARSCSNLSRT